MPTRRTIIRIVLAAVALAVSPIVGIVAVASLPPSIEQGARMRAWLSDADYLGMSGVRTQRNLRDCGVAALQMLVEHAGAEPLRLAHWQEIVKERGEGMTLLEMRRAATALGVATHGVRSDLAGLAQLPLPLIVHLDDHYAVLDRIDAKGDFYLRDPAMGRVRMPRTVFGAEFSGAVLALAAAPADPGHAAAARAARPSTGAARGDATRAERAR